MWRHGSLSEGSLHESVSHKLNAKGKHVTKPSAQFVIMPESMAHAEPTDAIRRSLHLRKSTRRLSCTTLASLPSTIQSRNNKKRKASNHSHRLHPNRRVPTSEHLPLLGYLAVIKTYEPETFKFVLSRIELPMLKGISYTWTNVRS